MDGCCHKFSRWVNYIFGSLVFLLGGLVVGVSIWYLFSEFSDLIETWWVWISLAAGILLMILSLVACCAAHKEKKCILSCFWVLAIILFIAFLVGAIGSTIFFTFTDEFAAKDLGQLNALETPDLDGYEVIRDGFVEVWRADNCSISCESDMSAEFICSSVECDTGVVQDKMTEWISEGLRKNINMADYGVCVALASGGVDIEEGISGAAAAWCVSSTAVITEVRDWTLGAMMGLWLVAVFTFILAVANCVLVCTRRRYRSDALFVRPPVNVLKV
ncbi:CD151 antigen, putative [Perkinsus marinus ATCC 50983]|uniref:CD151 antigen, putative n=1 Tax=Perkinsus marinus (strain ATCC 50983 / TXsc) TaxID=423536 RepID=C5K5Y8_PERM5|nr:CD151 antigen, putative [Perkinsus marinus ATCC 50983]EER20105.1 CD151 antigen, putative [Perkinsus marinus ATCC 50983]|eukprot:XP_002788309.1 CD151 antigen, putative [Perkinsus marinus ATCC 50983]